MGYELQSYQNHPDYTNTLSCCKRQPRSVVNLNDRVKRYIITEIIGVNTLVNWIDGNAFRLDTDTQIVERDKAFAFFEEIMQVIEKKDQLKMTDIRRFMGKSGHMQ